MLQGEFETITGIYPDVLLYEAAEQEYNNGDWASKAEFCDCFKADEDGLATECQRIANERWLKAEEHIGKLTAENSRLEDENENLRNEIGALHDRVDELSDEISELPTATLEVTEPEITVQSLHAAICKAETLMLVEFSREDVGTAHVGFDYLFKALGVE